MKTTRIFLTLAFITFISFTNFANATDSNDKGGRKDKKENKKDQEEDLNLYYEDPTPSMVEGFVLPQADIIIKVLDTKGELVLKSSISMEKFFSGNSKLDFLPKDSLFVIFYNNTAFYVLGTEVK